MSELWPLLVLALLLGVWLGYVVADSAHTKAAQRSKRQPKLNITIDEDFTVQCLRSIGYRIDPPPERRVH